MANVIIKDLIISTASAKTLNYSMGFVQDLSEHELDLQGGCGRTFTIRLPNGRVIIGMDMCAPFPIITSF